MTGKRFTVNYRENTRLYDVKDNLHILDCGGFAIEYNAKKCCEELNALHEENEELKSKVKRYMVIELLKSEDFANCHNCRNNRSVHDGVALDGMCAIKELMNLDGYFDTEYHKLPNGTICPCWELEE